MILKNEKLYELIDVAHQIKEHGNNKFKIFLLVVIDAISKRIELIESEFKPSDSIVEYNNKYKELVSNHCEKGDNDEIKLYELENGEGADITNTGSGIPNIIINKDEFYKLKEALDEEYKEALDESKKNRTDFIELMNEDCDDIQLPMIKESYLPDLTFEQLKTFKPLIKYEF